MKNKTWEYIEAIALADTDAFGAVYHGNYLRYFDKARTQILDSEGYPFAHMIKDGIGLLVRSASLDYRKPITFGDKAYIYTNLQDVKNTSFTVFQKMYIEKMGSNTGKGQQDFINEAKITLVCMNIKEKKPMAFPPKLKSILDIA